MKFTPKSEDQIVQEEKERKEAFLWPDKTIVDYEILMATDKVSTKGNDMIEVDVLVYNSEGKSKKITVYLGEWNIWLLKHICEANDMLAQYEAGDVASYDLYGKTGRAILGVEKGSAKDDGTFYNDKNVIKDFLKPAGNEVKEGKPIEEFLNDSVDF